MKKFLCLILSLALVLSLAACSKNDSETKPTDTPLTETPAVTDAPVTTDTPVTTDAPVTTEAPEITDAPEVTDAPVANDVTVLTYDQYAAAEIDDPVCIETYVQATQSWWNDAIVVYSQDKDGAYFIYNMACSEEDAAKLVPGTKIRVTGYKAEYAGEIEIGDGTFEFCDANDTYVAEPMDVTALLGKEELINYQSRKVSFKSLTVAPVTDADGNDAAFLYNWDGSGTQGDDLYFNVTDGANVYSFTVESYLCGKDTEVYKAVEALSIGDVIDLEGFLYWYNGVNPHITSVTKAENAPAADTDVKSEGVMTYAEYAAAEIDDPVCVETYVQATQSWWDNSIVVYSQDKDGAYFIYKLACSEEDAAKLVPGTKIKVNGYKAEYAGEIEISDATFEFEKGEYIADAKDVTALLADNAIADEMNKKVCFKGMTVEPSTDGDGNEAAFLYNWDGSGTQGDDLYFNVSVDGNTYQFTVESYLCGKDTDVYKAVEALKIGDVVDLEGFLYWYNGVNPHITSVTVK